MKAAFVIQIVQVVQYGINSANMDFFLVLADFAPPNINNFYQIFYNQI
jgi:hypothetical protein